MERKDELFVPAHYLLIAMLILSLVFMAYIFVHYSDRELRYDKFMKLVNKYAEDNNSIQITPTIEISQDMTVQELRMLLRQAEEYPYFKGLVEEYIREVCG